MESCQTESRWAASHCSTVPTNNHLTDKREKNEIDRQKDLTKRQKVKPLHHTICLDYRSINDEKKTGEGENQLKPVSESEK